MSMLSKFQKWICLEAGWKTYLGLTFIGLVPILAAWQIGVFHNREFKDTTHQLHELCQILLSNNGGMLTGFGHRYNWMMYPAALPFALWIVQRTSRILFASSKVSPLKDPDYLPFYRRTQPLLDNGRILGGVLIACVALHMIDMYSTVERFFMWPKLKDCPNDLDWGLYSFIWPEDVSQTGMIVLNVLIYSEQFILITFALLVLAIVFFFNRGYLSAFYLRSRETDQMTSFGKTRKMAYVLDFKDPNLEFGLGKMAPVFNWQLILAAIIGIIMLVSRYANVNPDEVTELWSQFYRLAQQVVQAKPIETLLDPSSPESINWQLYEEILTDPGQWLLIFGWLIMAFAVLRPANVKLLPFESIRSNAGRVAYLTQLIHPDTPWGRSLATLPKNAAERRKRSDLIDEIARSFSENTFWPTGNQPAQEGIFFDLVVFFLLIFPINPFSSKGVVAAITIGILSFLLTSFYLFYQKYFLKRVHDTLIADKKTL